MSVRITERFDGALAGCRVDEAAGVIHGAVLCGFTSANGRDYPRAVLEAAAPKYAGAKIHLNHAKDGRTIQDWIGVVESPTSGSDGRPRGRLEMFKSDPFVPKLLEAARRYPNKFGLSHVAMANTRRQNGREVVESIERIESVDFVTDPATVKGLFESVQQGGRAVANRATATRVIEDVMAGASGNLKARLRRVLVEQLDSKNYADAVGNAFLIAGHAVWTSALAGEITLADAIDKLRKLYQGHEAGGGSRADAGDVPAVESATAADFARSVTGRAGFGTLLREGRPAAAKDFACSIRS